MPPHNKWPHSTPTTHDELSPGLASSPSQVTFLGDVYLEHPAKLEVSGVVVFNHEYVVSTPADVAAPAKVNLLADAQHAHRAFPGGTVLHAGMSNNHTMDFGQSAFNRTVKELTREGVHCFGTAFDQSASLHLQSGIYWCVLGYTMAKPSTTMSAEALIPLLTSDLSRARQNGAQHVFVSIHFGNEHEPNATRAQRKVAHAAVDAGADLVVGHHTHCIQNAEVYRGKHIYYGLGNTWFPRHSTPAYFDDSGNSHRVFRARETRWNTQSLAVQYDLKSGDVTAWECSSQHARFRVIRITDISSINRVVAHRWPKLVGHMRRHWLFWKSNVCTDGLLVDVNAFLHKVREKGRYHKILPEAMAPKGL